MISRTSPEIQVHSSYTIPEPNTDQSQSGYVNPQTLLTPDPHPIDYIQSHEFQQQCLASPVQFSATIDPVKAPLPQVAPPVESRMVTRGQKKKIHQETKEEEQNYKNKERFLGEGSGKNNTIKEQEVDEDADHESLPDWQSSWDEYFEERRKEMAE